MERSFYIEKFRNIGLNESQKFILNRNLEKGKMGNLVIVIGENNSGKSNVLNALSEFKHQKMQERDRTLLDFSPESSIPKLSLTYKISEDEFFSYGFDINGKIYPKHTVSGETYTSPYMLDKKILTEFISSIQGVQSQYGVIDSEIDRYINKLLKLNDPIDAQSTNVIISELMKRIDYTANVRLSRFKQYIFNHAVNNPITRYYSQQTQSVLDKANILKNDFKNRFNIDLIPNIYIYKDEQINTSDLSNEQNSEFIKTVLRTIDIDPQELEKVYSQFRATKSRGILNTEETKLNKLLQKVSAHFNAVYYQGKQAENEGYSFKFNLDSNNIFISLYRGGRDINLDYQSTGFKWFFNLYFNLISKSELKAGDILIMDEPATNLHISGQIELRKFLKQFALKNDLTIIIATHSPWLIDLDYLDELRVISLKNNESFIHNDFTTVDENDADSLKPIKQCLTASNHILLDPDKKVIFVEGITDYNYFTTFKKMLGKDEIVFLPINGVGKFDSDIKNKQAEIIKSLQKIKKHNAILLVDGDAAGKSIQEFSNKNHSELKVFTLDEVSQEFKDIESLFSQADLSKLQIIENGNTFTKSSSSSATLKTFYSQIEFSKSTVNNFKKLFNFIDSL